MKTIHAIIHGRVQGVFFRDSTQKKAQSLMITGWVRNNIDGTVECKVTGEADAIENFIAWLHKGPKHAEVSKVESSDVPSEIFSTFEIRDVT